MLNLQTSYKIKFNENGASNSIITMRHLAKSITLTKMINKGVICRLVGLLWQFISKEFSCHVGDSGSILVGKILWSRKWQPAPASLPRKLHGQRRLVGYSP